MMTAPGWRCVQVLPTSQYAYGGTRYDTWLMPHQMCFEHPHVLDGSLAALLYTYLGTVTSVAAMSRWT